MSNNLGVKMKKVWLVGAGVMAQDYIKVLNDLDCDFLVIGRGESNSTLCKNKFGCETINGGLEGFLSTNPEKCSYAIVAVGVDRLYETTKNLLNYGIKNILVEKPGALYKEEFKELNDLANKTGSNLLIAYNRRFYASVLKAEKIIEIDGGVTSFNFEFTEWAHEIEALEKPQIVKEK
jgi:predicted dehydrogenase